MLKMLVRSVDVIRRLNGRRKFSTHLVKDLVSGAAAKGKKEEGQDKQYSATDLFRGKKGRVQETETTMVLTYQLGAL